MSNLTSLFPSKHPTRRCPVPACGRPCHGYSSYCSLHAGRQYQFGHFALRKGILETDLKPYAKWVQAGLTKYKHTRGTANVLKLIDERILNYTVTSEIVRHQRDLARLTQLMRHHEVSASDVLFRVAVFQAFAGANLGRFRGSTRAERIALGRMVLRLVPLRRQGVRYATKTVELLAEELSWLVLPYVNRLLSLQQEEDAKARASVDASLDFSTPERLPEEPPRAGRSRRKRLGVVP